MSEQYKPPQTFYWTYKQFQSAEANKERKPSKYMFRNALGDYVFIKTRDRAKAQEYIDIEYEGVYRLICTSVEDSKNTPTAFGKQSTKGQKKYN